MENKKYLVPITDEMVRAANMTVESGLTITAVNKAIVITETDVLECVPDELLDLFDELDISEDVVRKTLLNGNNGILEKLMTCQQ